MRVIAAAGALFSLTGAAATHDAAQELLATYALKAQAADPAFSGFSAERGHDFYLSAHVLKGVGMVSCASRHRKHPHEQIVAHKVGVPCRASHVINDEEHLELPRETALNRAVCTASQSEAAERRQARRKILRTELQNDAQARVRAAGNMTISSLGC